MNTKNERSRGAHIRTPINRHTQQSDPRISIYTLNDRKYYTHLLFIFHFSFFVFTYIQNVRALNTNHEALKMRSKMDKHALKY